MKSLITTKRFGLEIVSVVEMSVFRANHIWLMLERVHSIPMISTINHWDSIINIFL